MTTRMYAVSGLIAAVVVAVGTLAVPAVTALAEDPDALLPPEVSAGRPARVVSTTLDADGRPVVNVRTATNRPDARQLIQDSRKAPRSVAVEIDAQAHTTDVTTGTDPGRAQQWDFSELAITSAWPYATGSGVTVAVIDTGVDATHPDLTGNVLPGYDAISRTTGTSSDANGHGTHVAGTIAALTGNSIGVSSIAPEAGILPVRVLGADGSGNMSDVATGIVWAADHGADVINMSLGSSSQLAAVTQAIAYARNQGVTVVAAAGNDGANGNPVSYPGADAGVIAVAATDSSDTVASFSTKGSYVDVAAPGVGILSTLPGNSYGTGSGTSMASPHVAAAAALLTAYQPTWTPDQVEAALENTAVDLGAAGKDTSYGYGRIAPVAALAGAQQTTTTSPTATASPTTTTTASPSPTASLTPTASPTPTPVATVTATPTATATAAPTATATNTPAKATPVVAVTTGDRDVRYGATITTSYAVTVSGTHRPGQSVQVCTSTAGAAFVCEAATTSTAGSVTVTATATANRRIRLTVPATSTTAAVTSAITTYTVRPKVTVTRPAARRIKITMVGVSGQTVTVQRLTTAGWSKVRTYPALSTRTVTGLVAGARYRVVVSATTTLTATTSSTVTA